MNCKCGTPGRQADELPSASDREIVAVYHIHHRAGLAEIVHMEPIQTTVGSPEREPELAGAAR